MRNPFRRAPSEREQRWGDISAPLPFDTYAQRTDRYREVFASRVFAGYLSLRPNMQGGTLPIGAFYIPTPCQGLRPGTPTPLHAGPNVNPSTLQRTMGTPRAPASAQQVQSWADQGRAYAPFVATPLSPIADNLGAD